MTCRLILIAHGETAATRRAAFPADEPLVPHARDKASRCATALPRATRVLRSPAIAAAETAAAFGCEAAIEPILGDLDCARWRGRTLGEVAETEPEQLGAWLADPAFAAHGGGSIADLCAAIATWLSERRKDRGVTLAITHPAVVRGAVLAALGAPATAFWHIDVAPLTRAELSSDGRRWILRQIVQAAP